jgi:hypothetical protein
VCEGESVCVCVAVRVDEGVCESVPEPSCELVWEAVPACVSDCDAVGVWLGDCACETLCVCEPEDSCEPLCVSLGESVCEALGVWDGDCVGLEVWVWLAV